MKPSDLFLGIRQLFGAAVPGCIWTIALGLCISATSINQFVAWKDIEGIQVAAFLGISFLLGKILQPLAFGIATELAASRLFVNKLFNVFRWQGGEGHVEFANRVTERVKSVVNDHVATVLKGKEGSAWSTDADTKRREESHLFELCKKIIVERSERLGKELEEREGDINLVASIPLPLILLTVAVAQRASELTTLNLRWDSTTWCWLIPATGFAVVCVLLIQVYEMMESERRACFEIFLTLTEPLPRQHLEYGTVPPAIRPDVNPNKSVAPVTAKDTLPCEGRRHAERISLD